MKNTLLVASLIVVIIGATYVNLIISLGPSAVRGKAAQEAGAGWSGPSPVPDLATIVKSREERGNGMTNDTLYHTISTPPETYVFQTKYKNGTQIVFNHAAHVDALGLACIECHHVEGCGKCHLRDRAQAMSVASGKEALHATCMGCHAKQGGPKTCDECHVQ
ncbi:MAG: cytochrome c family protein [Lentisphaerae bacterium]|nr:cytochrome c family protein [Lentisphaerota bacterium]